MVALRLVVVRHAKSAWPAAVPDHERPLSGRGRRDAPAIGQWLREEHCTPDLVICSTAVRARTTWQLASEAFSPRPEVMFERRVYEADETGLLDVVRHVPDHLVTVALVGHHPGVQDLVLMLAGSGEAEALRAAREKFATSAVAVLTRFDSWSGLSAGQAMLSAFAVARG